MIYDTSTHQSVTLCRQIIQGFGHFSGQQSLANTITEAKQLFSRRWRLRTLTRQSGWPLWMRSRNRMGAILSTCPQRPSFSGIGDTAATGNYQLTHILADFACRRRPRCVPRRSEAPIKGRDRQRQRQTSHRNAHTLWTVTHGCYCLSSFSFARSSISAKFFLEFNHQLGLLELSFKRPLLPLKTLNFLLHRVHQLCRWPSLTTRCRSQLTSFDLTTPFRQV